MGFVIFALLVGVPILEIAVFIEVGGWIGLWPTIAVVVLTAIAGTTLLRLQGLSVLERAQRSLERQEFPVAEIVDGVCILVAGALLLTPGFVTDALGFALMIPGLRMAMVRPLWRYMAAHGGVRVWSSRTHRGAHGEIIEGVYEEVRPEKEDSRGGDGSLPGGGGRRR